MKAAVIAGVLLTCGQALAQVSPCGSDVQLPNTTVTIGTTGVYATNYISAGSTSGSVDYIVNTSSSGSASVTFQAGSAICLGPGFHAIAGTATTTFHALIATPMTISPSSMTAPVDGGAVGTITITTNPSGLAWTAGSDSSWLGVGATSGTGSGSLIVYAVGNGFTARTGHVNLYAGADLLAQVTVTQAGTTLTAAPLTINTSSDGTPGATISVATASTSATWAASSSQTWAIISAGSSGTGNATVTVGVQPNGSLTSRTAYITITDGTNPETVTINQSGVTLYLSPTSWTPVYGGGSTTLTVNAGTGISWTAASDSSWLTVGGSSSYSSSGTASPTVVATASSMVNPRTGTITVTGGGTTATFLVQQAGTTFSVSTTPSSLTSPLLSIGGGSVGSITVTTSAAWTAASSDSWLTISPTSGTGGASISVSASSNSSASRTASISFVSGGVTVATINAQQAGTTTSGTSVTSAREYIRLGSRIIAVQAVNTNGPPTSSGTIIDQPNTTTGLGGYYSFTATDPVNASYISVFQPFLTPGYTLSGSTYVPYSANSCHMYWQASSQTLSLDDLNDSYNWVGSTVLGTGGIDLSNGICTVHGSVSSVSTWGPTLTLNLLIDFAPQPSAATYYPFASVTNNTATTPWNYLGSDSPVSALSSSVISLWGGIVQSPDPSTGHGAVIRFAAQDPSSYSNISLMQGYLATSTGPGTTGCDVFWEASAGPGIYLGAGTSDDWGTVSAVGGGGIDLPHSGDPPVPLCVVHAGASSSFSTPTGTSQEVDLVVDVTPGYTYYLYGWARSTSAGDVGWQVLGWFTVP